MYKLILMMSLFYFGSGLIKKSTPVIKPITNLSEPQPKELGKVKWLRDINQATSLATKEKKPIFLLFQEVPGCSTCQNYGKHVLSYPLIVEAIETYFIPLAIYNNKGGKDREVLEYFNEPAWNNPVVRIINDKKKNLIDRVNGNYSILGVTEAMINVLENRKSNVPTYLKLLQEELSATQLGTETTYLSMYCFWSGEKQLADIDGVVETNAGFMDGREVVRVKYSPSTIHFDDLVKKAKSKSCASHVYSDDLQQQLRAEKLLGSEYVSEKSNFSLDKETKYYLYKSSYKYLPMTALQAAKANSLIGKGASPNAVFSTRQLEALKYIQANPDKKWTSAINVDLMEAWEKFEAKL